MYRKAGELLLRLGYQAASEKLTVVLLKVRGLSEVGNEDEKVAPGMLLYSVVLYTFSDTSGRRKKKKEIVVKPLIMSG